MTLADFAAIAVEVFQPYVLLWAVIMIIVCSLLAVFVSLVQLFMSRI